MLVVGVLTGGAGSMLGRGFPGTWSPDVASVLSDGRIAGLVSPDFRVRFAVSINWGANFRRGGLSPLWLFSAKDPSLVFRALSRLLLEVVSTSCGLNLPLVLLASSTLRLLLLLDADVSTGWTANFRVDLVEVSTGCGANLRCILEVVSMGSGTNFRALFVVVSMGSGANFRVLFVVVSTGSGANFRVVFAVVSTGSAANFRDDFEDASTGSTLNRLTGGVEDIVCGPQLLEDDRGTRLGAEV